MDEVLIEEKKYISSKRAAEITGYAKDYVGQLCREGRVPARLIGRGWYVLETAIQDHRFGDSDDGLEKTTWETPRYESAPMEEILPFIDNQKEPNVSQDIQESWRAWFDRFDSTPTEEPEKPKVEDSEESVDEGKKEEEPEKPAEPEEPKEENINIPIHTIYKPLPADLLPTRSTNQQQEERKGQKEQKSRRWNKIPSMRTAQVVIAFLAVLTTVTAIAGSGYFDEYILSVSPARIMAGVTLYNK